jgi:glycosyltransferase involved in cell wall biosynthesis
VLPSVFESFGIVLIEAQASGKPVIGTRVGGVPEAIKDGESGLLIDPGNVEQLAESIVRLLLDEELAREMGENGKIYVKSRFDIKKNVTQITNIYEDLISIQC